MHAQEVEVPLPPAATLPTLGQRRADSGAAAPAGATATLTRGVSNVVTVTDENLGELEPFIPTAHVGHRCWIIVYSTWRGAVSKAFINDTDGSEADFLLKQAHGRDNGARPLDPRPAVRLIKELEGFESEAVRHLSVSATYKLAKRQRQASASAAVAADATSAAGMSSDVSGAGASSSANEPAREREPVPIHMFNEHVLLGKLEEFVEGDAFIAATEAFAADHAHKFHPLTADDEYPLHYQELYLQFEGVLEAALESFLRENQSSVLKLLELVGRARERGDPLRCIDVLLASTEFPAFLEMMLDYKFAMYAGEHAETPASVVADVAALSQAGTAQPQPKAAL